MEAKEGAGESWGGHCWWWCAAHTSIAINIVAPGIILPPKLYLRCVFVLLKRLGDRDCRIIINPHLPSGRMMIYPHSQRLVGTVRDFKYRYYTPARATTAVLFPPNRHSRASSRA